ncbi:MAG: DUF342 domain-containing protein [Lachnospiraceae bacterium]|nr:DUF342 domain-containing protein [Lachnospiraceae bacterium]
MQKNGYFQLINIPGGHGIKIVAPKEDGKPVNLYDAINYLKNRNYPVELAKLAAEIQKGVDTVIPLNGTPCPVEHAVVNASLAEDGMTVTINIIPPSENGPKPTVSDIIGELRHRQVIFGIKEERIREAIEAEMYCTDLIAAEGIKPRHGTDATIEYHFNTDLNQKPAQKEDGSVDFFNLNTISHCKAGDVLATLTPADPGEYGTDVFGARIKPRDVKKIIFKHGNNIEVSEDGLTMIAQVNGHVTLVEGKVFVSNVFEVENVNPSTGNIDFSGSVQISGDVQAGYRVKAGGNVIINGAVEGAYIEAEGDIIIARGMNGMNKGELHAGGNIVARFLENATAIAAGYVHAESIVHCNIQAGTEVTVDGRRGNIAGGRICATSMISTKVLGSEMGVSTIAEVGVDPSVKARYAQVQQDLMEVAKEIKSIDPIIETYKERAKQKMQFTAQQSMYISSLLDTRAEKARQLAALNKEMLQLSDMLSKTEHAQVVVYRDVYPGVKIGISEVSMIVQSNMKYCKFIKERGDVKMVGI